MKTARKVFGWFCIAGVMGLAIAMIAYPAAVTQVAGLAVAQSTNQWNQLKDMTVGDAQTTGVGLFAPCLWNGTSCDRQRGSISGGAEVAVKSVSGGVTPADGFTTPTNALTAYSYGALFNNSTADRQRGISAANNTATTSIGSSYVSQLSTWSQTNTPAVATAATTSKAAGGGTVRHVATSITWCVAANATAQPPLLIHLRDGATGAGTIIRTWAVSAPVNGTFCEDLSGLNMTGSANTAMTLETAAAPAAAVQATVSFTGYSTP
jgi:hypothetical protein